jgi:lysophospholipase L1-like esterase
VEPLRLVALGDAYTAGTHTLAPKRDSWPAQLVAAMEQGDVRLRLVDNLADSGQTSEDVMRSQLPQLEALVPDVVTLQVGVNDIIARDIGLDDYRTNLAAIVDQLLLELAPGRIFLITTPDHTLTTRGADWGSRASGHAEVVAANAILTQVGAARGITVVDIGPVNRLASGDASLVIGEGPYPTAKQYAGWVEIIGPAMRRVLTNPEP